MIILSWNCRGFGNPCAVTVLSHLVREKPPNVLFLMKMKRTVDEMKTIQADLHYDAMGTGSSPFQSEMERLQFTVEIDFNIIKG